MAPVLRSSPATEGGKAGRGLDESALIKELEEIARRLGIEVRYENLKKEGGFTSGGLCLLKGQYLLIVNSRAAARDKIDALAAAVNRFDLTRLYLKPGVRDFLDGFQFESVP
jgi:hypothetical protein